MLITHFLSCSTHTTRSWGLWFFHSGANIWSPSNLNWKGGAVSRKEEESCIFYIFPMFCSSLPPRGLVKWWQLRGVLEGCQTNTLKHKSDHENRKSRQGSLSFWQDKIKRLQLQSCRLGVKLCVVSRSDAQALHCLFAVVCLPETHETACIMYTRCHISSLLKYKRNQSEMPYDMICLRLFRNRVTNFNCKQQIFSLFMCTLLSWWVIWALKCQVIVKNVVWMFE